MPVGSGAEPHAQGEWGTGVRGGVHASAASGAAGVRLRWARLTPQSGSKLGCRGWCGDVESPPTAEQFGGGSSRRRSTARLDIPEEVIDAEYVEHFITGDKHE